MATPVVMPKQGQSVETCIITGWYKKPGEEVKEGDILFSYETDKAAFDLEAPAGGTLLHIFFNEGEEVPVLVNVAVIGHQGEEYMSFQPGNKTVEKRQEQEQVITDKIVNTEKQNFPDQKIRISPRAKLLANAKGINPEGIRGTGPGNRIVVSDIENADTEKYVTSKEDAISGSEYEDRPLTNIRKLIAGAMKSSLQNSAQLTHHMSADVRSLLGVRQNIKNDIRNGKHTADITINDMVCWCVIRALRHYPEINSHLTDETLRIFKNVHLGFAVDTPRGLMVPAIRNADMMDLNMLSAELKTAADSCRKGNIDPGLIKSTSASFTVSNLGNYGVEMFTPVLNLPQVAILGICTIINRPVDIGDNTFAFVPHIGLSLTYDHRAIDGGPATLFLKQVKEEIEKYIL